MVINRIIDNASVAIASLNRAPIVAARAQALTHGPTTGGKGAKVFGIERAGVPGMGRLGQRRRRPRTRLPRHLPGRGLLPPGRQHPADPGRRPARRLQRRGPDPRHRHRLRDPGEPGQGHLPAQAQDRPRGPPRPLRRRRHRHAAGPRRRDDLPVRGPGAAHHHRHPAVPQGRNLHLEGPRPRVRRARWPSKPRTGPCAGRPPPCRSTKAKTASSPGCSTARTPPTRSRCPTPGEAKRAILDTYTKEHSAEYQAQAWIDLARKLHSEHPEATDPANVNPC